MTAWTGNELWLLNEMREQGKDSLRIVERLNRLFHNGTGVRDSTSVQEILDKLKSLAAKEAANERA